MASKVSIISNAFSLLGRQPIQDLTAGTSEQIASTLYDKLLPDILTKHPWRFATCLRSLNKTTSTPVINEWQHIYQFPSDCLLAWRIYPYSNYQIYQNKLYSNELSLTLEYLAQVDESLFPAYFIMLMVYAMAELLAMPITQQPPLVQYWGAKAKTQFLSAQYADSQAKPSNAIFDNALWAAHWS